MVSNLRLGPPQTDAMPTPLYSLTLPVGKTASTNHGSVPSFLLFRPGNVSTRTLRNWVHALSQEAIQSTALRKLGEDNAAKCFCHTVL